MKYSTQNKLGRNSICQCGSGKKYKKCCMNDETILNNSKTLIQTSMGAIKQRNPEHAALFFDSEEMGVIKMSEVILEYADELLELATTDKGKENALLFAITAWNISLADEDKRSEMINSFIVDIWNVRKGSTQWKDMYEIFKKLIDIKLYSSHTKFEFYSGII
jgi:hypothetical protein